MRIITILIMFLSGPAIADTVPTTNNSSNTVNGDIHGNITGDLGGGSDPDQARRSRGLYGCDTDRNGRTTCR